MAIEHDGLALRAKDRTTLRDVFARFPDIRRVMLFGSRATGTARRASDLDIAIDAPGMSRGAWARLIDALEEAPIIYFIDAVRLDTLHDESLRRNIAEDGVVIYAAHSRGSAK